MFRSRRKLFSQNFLHDRELVKQLIRNSSIGKNDLVVEIGPGRGIITQELLRNGRRVIAVEIDKNWYRYLQIRFRKSSNFCLVRQNVLNFGFPHSPFKVFANIPFYLEGRLVRKLLREEHLEDCYLVVRRDVAYRWAGNFGNNMFQIMHLPWFDFSLFYHFQKSDFLPVTKVEAVMLQITRKDPVLLPECKKDDYQKFVTKSFENWCFSYSPLRLSLKQWLDLYTHLTPICNSKRQQRGLDEFTLKRFALKGLY